MTLSLGLTFALFFLAPGLGFFGGLFFPPATRFSRDPPPPGSILTLAVVGVGALALHTIWSLALTAAQIVYDRVGGLGAPPGSNLYAVAHAVGAEDGPVALARYAWGFVQLALLTGAGYALGVGAFRLRPIRRALLGWLFPLDEDLGQSGSFLAAFVLSKSAHDGVSLGYRGIVRHARLDSDRQIAALVIEDALKFTLRIHASGGSTTRDVSQHPLPLLQLERAEIANVVLAVLDTRIVPALPPSDAQSPAPGGPARG